MGIEIAAVEFHHDLKGFPAQKPINLQTATARDSAPQLWQYAGYSPASQPASSGKNLSASAILPFPNDSLPALSQGTFHKPRLYPLRIQLLRLC